MKAVPSRPSSSCALGVCRRWPAVLSVIAVACAAIVSSGRSVCRPTSQPPNGGDGEGDEDADAQRPTQVRGRCLELVERRHHHGDVGVLTVLDALGEHAHLDAVDHGGVEDVGHEAGTPRDVGRRAPPRQQSAVGPCEDQRAIRGEHLDARFVGGRLEAESFAELRAHHALQREHQPFQLVVEALEHHALLPDVDDERAGEEHEHDHAAVPRGQPGADRPLHADGAVSM